MYIFLSDFLPIVSVPGEIGEPQAALRVADNELLESFLSSSPPPSCLINTIIEMVIRKLLTFFQLNRTPRKTFPFLERRVLIYRRKNWRDR